MKIRSTSALITALLLANFHLTFAQIVSDQGSSGFFHLTLGKQSFRYDPYFMADSLNISRGGRYNENTAGNDSSYFAKPSSMLTMIGIQSCGLYGGFLLGGEMSFGAGRIGQGSQQSFDSNGIKTGASYGKTSSRAMACNILYNMGYLALKKRGFVMIPAIGAGWGVSGMLLSAESPQRIYPAIAGALGEGNKQNVLIWTHGFVLDGGIGMNYIFGQSSTDNARGFTLGLKLGYQWQLPGRSIWLNELENAKNNPAWAGKDVSLPRVGNSGFYIKMLIGMGKVTRD